MFGTSGRTDRKPRVLAVASGGGHWVQLLRLRPAFEDCDIAYATVSDRYRSEVGDARFYVFNDATRWDKLGLARMALRLTYILLRERPDVVISTGAAPGFFTLQLSKLLGCRTVWLDSIANVEEMSMSGSKVGRCADLWLTQWPHLARPQGPHYQGAVL